MHCFGRITRPRHVCSISTKTVFSFVGSLMMPMEGNVWRIHLGIQIVTLESFPKSSLLGSSSFNSSAVLQCSLPVLGDGKSQLQRDWEKTAGGNWLLSKSSCFLRDLPPVKGIWTPSHAASDVQFLQVCSGEGGTEQEGVLHWVWVGLCLSSAVLIPQSGVGNHCDDDCFEM